MRFIFYCYLELLIKKDLFFEEQIILLNNRNPVNKTRRTELAVTHESTSLLTYMLI